MGENDQAVFVFLSGTSLPREVYDNFDVVTLEDQLIEAINREHCGEADGTEFGPEEVQLFMYGPDAERLYRAIEPVLKCYPLCRGARVLIRPGGPDVEGRQ